MSELEYNTTISHIRRSRDVYKVHDTSKKQKKQKRGENEKEFLAMLEESEKDVEDFNAATKQDDRKSLPAEQMLERLGMNAAPPPVIEVEKEDK